MKRLSIIFILFLTGCVGVPDDIEPVKDFKLDRYLGKWYELARLDHSFERGLTKVTAEYSMQSDGGVKVVNRGFSPEKGAWDEVVGKAYFVKGQHVGHLKVSFFGPFYSSYIILDLDQDNYQYAMVSGPNRSYLWILGRSPNVDKKVIDSLILKAAQLGFGTDKLIFVKHD